MESEQVQRVRVLTGADENERERLAKEIADQLVAGHGSVVRWTADVAAWRSAARRAGRLLGVPVRTGVSDDVGRRRVVVPTDERSICVALECSAVRRSEVPNWAACGRSCPCRYGSSSRVGCSRTGGTSGGVIGSSWGAVAP